MPAANTPAVSRNFSTTDGKRVILSVAILLVVAASYWFILPVIQLKIVPHAPGGTYGPWLLRPTLAGHFCAVAVMTSVTFPLAISPLTRKWKHQDAAIGSRYDPLAGRPDKRAVLIFKGTLLLIVYATGLIFYLLSWETVGPDGIRQHLPWFTRHYSYHDIASLEMIPDGEWSDSLNQNGPWYSIKLHGDRSITWSLDNEGTTKAELTAIATYVAQRTGLGWARTSDARAR